MTTAEAVRAAGAELAERADDVSAACRALDARASDAGQEWRGLAADTAAEHAQDLTTRAARVADAFVAGADVLRTCAAQLAEADGLRRRADQLARHHEDADLLAASQRLRAEAAATTELALHRAARALRELSAPAAPQRSQLRGFAHGLWGVLADTAEQGWNLDPHLIGLHPRAWWSTVSTDADGMLQAAKHPTAALSAAAGLDQLREHAYGEWAGTLLGTALTGLDTGGTGRVAGAGRRLGRSAMIVAEDGRWAVRREYVRGGRVRPRDGLTLPSGFPRRIKDLADGRIRHILVGDEAGGGHRSGVGRAGKTEFPPDWSDDDIIKSAMETAMHPETVELQQNGNYRFQRRFGGVTVRVAVSQRGEVLTAHPLKGGVGVVHNRRGASR